MKIGITLAQFTDDRSRFDSSVSAAEQAGFDSIWLFDHLWPLSGGKQRPILESWTTLSYLAAATRDIGVGTLVTRSTLRHPAVLAKMAANVSEIAPGRLTVAIGSGDEASRGENEAFGLPYHADEDRIDQLRAYVECVVRCLHEKEVTMDDDFVTVESLQTSPRPQIPPPVWVAGRSDDAIEVAATLADGWNGWGGDVARFTQDAGTVLGLAGDRPVEVTWGGLISLEGSGSKRSGDASEALTGSPAGIAEALAGFAEAGATHLIVTPMGRWEDAVEALATEIVPLLRASFDG
jgi:alkanesulfonate monooxygenase SsuD/methylene tetrahydromethanopterin reductase-like flavin-dependent oxidoreductase (luciferase family)